jgi:hypothetical protein
LNANDENSKRFRDSQYGRLETWHDGSWGTICDIGFDKEAAAVACASLGFREYGWFSNHYKISRGNLGNLNVESGRKVHFSNFECDGTEEDLFQCQYTG